ncbi:hypothetical protein LSTR_LSTR004618 [Laodelphax striatellus]|uniref:Uncharacterized protein n=1 Tax=Laodelphax striatellus TaxID=195883 RepID=A0A482WV75_LAOST|nr:hypothetical protein LSTR_LSTR004618 [Laodelphax striatellus]
MSMKNRSLDSVLKPPITEPNNPSAMGNKHHLPPFNSQEHGNPIGKNISFPTKTKSPYKKI